MPWLACKVHHGARLLDLTTVRSVTPTGFWLACHAPAQRDPWRFTAFDLSTHENCKPHGSSQTATRLTVSTTLNTECVTLIFGKLRSGLSALPVWAGAPYKFPIELCAQRRAMQYQVVSAKSCIGAVAARLHLAG